MKKRYFGWLLAVLLAGLTLSQQGPFQQRVNQAIQSGGSRFAEAMKQDPDQALCSIHRDRLPPELAGAFLERQRALIKYPANGKLMGDWKQGEALFTDPRKGNCYACHTGDPKEAGAGLLGPGLVGYGQRGISEPVVKYTYDKIYNAWATMPCSLMYRAGVHGILTPEESAHVTAFLLEPASPVNARR
ncbi:sulfur oxidation c-type cytochrome SoxX [uncultured Meiothermus sp.]|uniref:sulfur oxidation c-type cytochrome SoxX n=1 Tax=uncultured Meiothermus sp. TaxID=157471 RepID=UPI00261223DB|nr:sulfur oxidation c-type cytochrome SoxX [uncultured Meiothermus sp.]